MARYWKPKYKCQCTKCGWTGTRTMLTISIYPCPSCWKYLDGLTVREKIRHITAIGKDWRTIKKVTQ